MNRPPGALLDGLVSRHIASAATTAGKPVVPTFGVVTNHSRSIQVPAETHTHFASLDRQRILEIVADRLAEILEIEPSSISEEDNLVDDLHADSLAQYQLVEALVDEFGERTVSGDLENDDLEDLELVRDAVDYVVARIG